MERPELEQMVKELRSLPDAFFEGLELALAGLHLNYEEKEKVRKAVKPILLERRIIPTQFPAEFILAIERGHINLPGLSKDGTLK